MTVWRAALGIAIVLGSPLAAQTQSGTPRATLKQSTLTPAPAPACASVSRPASPTPEQRRSARQMAQRGQEAAILGDSVTALAQLRQATALDPSDPDLAYQLARAYEAAGAGADAAKEFCRFLALAPNAPEANEARERARTLTPQRPDPSYVAATSAFNLGVAAYGKGQLVQAETHFSTAIASHSTWAEAYYDRAVVRAERAMFFASVLRASKVVAPMRPSASAASRGESSTRRSTGSRTRSSHAACGADRASR